MNVTEFDVATLDGAPGVAMSMLAPGTSAERVRVDLAVLEAGSVLPKHRAGCDQAFWVISGVGEVASDDDVRVEVGPGSVVEWDAGEIHTTWATTQLTAVIVQRLDA